MVVFIRGMFRKKIINASSNLKKDLHSETKIKSNECLDIVTEGVFPIRIYIKFMTHIIELSLQHQTVLVYIG